MKLENLMLSDRARHKRSGIVGLHFDKMGRTGKSTDIEGRWGVAGGWWEVGGGE